MRFTKQWDTKKLILTCILAIAIIVLWRIITLRIESTEVQEKTDYSTEPAEIIRILDIPSYSVHSAIYSETLTPSEKITEEVEIGEEPNPYGDWSYDDYILLASTIYCEADPHGYIEEAKAIGQVIRNRLESKEIWNDNSWLEVISRDNPKQFTVYSTDPESKFQKTMSSIDQSDDLLSNNAKEAALEVMNIGYDIPDTVQFFCSVEYYESVKKSNGNWASHPLYKIIGGTAFFYIS